LSHPAVTSNVQYVSACCWTTHS